MIQDFPLEAECVVCEKFIPCVTRDDDLGGPLCQECLQHVKVANEFIINDLIQCGIFK